MHPRLIQILALLATAGLLFGSSRFIKPINTGRLALDQMGTARIEDTAPPEYAFLIQAFGAFRGIATNILFIRAEEYKQAGRYYDAMQLASWICKLQPRFPTVWGFHAWNMAWNISVTTYTPEERWNWVYNGVKLLRDEGLIWNPRAVNLYKELAWIFVNKMSATTDQYHYFYKKNWAWRMHLVLGSPPDPLGDYRPDQEFEAVEIEIGADRLAEATLKAARQRVAGLKEKLEMRGAWYDIEAYEAALKFLEELEAAEEKQGEDGKPLSPSDLVRQAFYEWMTERVNAPDTLKQLHDEFPATIEMVRALRDVDVQITDDRINEVDFMRKGGIGDNFFYRYRVLTEPPALLAEVMRTPESEEVVAQRERLGEILKLAERDPAGEALVHWLEKKVLREVFKLEPEKLAELIAIFGPLDYRAVDSQSLYWVNEGLIASEESPRNMRNDKTNTARMIFFSLRNLMQRNRITFEPFTFDVNYAYINFNPDLNFIEPMHQAYLIYGKMIDPEPEKTGVGFTFRTGHVNFLSEAIRLLWFANRPQEAARYYEYLRDNYGRKPNGTFDPTYAKPLDQYVRDTMQDTEGTQSEERNRIYGWLDTAWQQLSAGATAQANMLIEAAREKHRKYNEDEVGEEEVVKMALPPFDDIITDTLFVWFRQPATNGVLLLEKARLWRMLGTELKQPVYDRLSDQFRQECDLYEFDLATAFPEPPGMQEWRDANPSRAMEKEEDPVETPAQND